MQGPLLLHDKAIHMASGNTPPIASYALADGKFTGSQASRGKDLFVRNGKVRGSGYPLYWRPEDDQFLSTMELETPAGVLILGMPQNNPSGVSELRMVPKNAGPKAKNTWSNPIFQEIAAVAIAKNAVIVTGLNRDKKDYQKISAGVVALDINNGTVLWRQDLPARADSVGPGDRRARQSHRRDADGWPRAGVCKISRVRQAYSRGRTTHWQSAWCVRASTLDAPYVFSFSVRAAPCER